MSPSQEYAAVTDVADLEVPAWCVQSRDRVRVRPRGRVDRITHHPRGGHETGERAGPGGRGRDDLSCNRGHLDYLGGVADPVDDARRRDVGVGPSPALVRSGRRYYFRYGSP